MSSLLAHAAAGAAVARSRHRPPGLTALAVAAAVAPDADYLLAWFAGVHLQPRLTHSVAFVAFIALLLSAAWRAATGPNAVAGGVVGVLFAAGLTHLVLDALVGVHGAPLLWPLTAVELTSPVGLLPSAGAIHLANPVLWRNLALEALILAGPVLTAARRPRYASTHEAVRAHAALWLLTAAAALYGATLARP